MLSWETILGAGLTVSGILLMNKGLEKQDEQEKEVQQAHSLGQMKTSAAWLSHSQ